MSCNGCRVLRKGCSDTCVLRQCLRSIDSPDAQGHATSFVAKFFGRARMMTLISSVPDNQRPALFQSLLYEACGRTINPVFGAVGLLCSGNWKVCQEAAETVMKGGAETVLMKGGGLICSPSISLGSGRQQIHLTMQQIHHQTAAAAKVRSGRGFAMVSHATSSCNSDQVDVKPGMKRKEELDEEMNKQRLMKQRRLLNRREEVTSVISRGGGDGDEAEGEADKNAEGVGKKADLACNDEQGPGLDLTLGTAALSCYGDDAAADDDDQDHHHHPGTGFTAKYVNRCSRARRSSPSSCEHSHSSVADSDTTDLSISIQSRSAAAAASTTRRDLLLDLLH